jgi:hypothetical protein
MFNCGCRVLTMATPKNMSVSSGPADTISLSMEDRTRPLMAMELLGMVITMAAETRRKAQIRPEM